MPDRSLRRDERAIEGLPIRLVIALVVGVASLGVMMNTISGLGTLGVSELDVQPEPDVIPANATDVTVTVVDSTGEPVANATVIAKSGDARVDGPVTAETGDNGTATLTVNPTLSDNQQQGTVEFDVVPPSGEYDDRRENTALVVIRD
ncbi:MAG: carboxypeptidase regulatory-like domain-containing protein [Haloarculaceae archaeon]